MAIAPTAPPTDLYAETTSKSLYISWEPPAIEHTNGLIRYYSIKLYEMQTGLEYLIESNVSDKTITDLHPYYSYECSVAAFTVNIGPYSNVITETLDEAGENISGYTH